MLQPDIFMCNGRDVTTLHTPCSWMRRSCAGRIAVLLLQGGEGKGGNSFLLPLVTTGSAGFEGYKGCRKAVRLPFG